LAVRSGDGLLIYRFEDCELDIGRHELRRGGIVRPVEPQVFDLLHFLIANRHRAVSRDEIFETVWRGRIVSDSVLGNRINAARKAIGDNGTQQRLIRTLRRNGFRFVGALSEETERSSSAGAHNPILVKPWKLSLVVLPFTFGLVDEELACICKGLADDLTTALARSRSFNVIAHYRLCADGGDPRQIASEFGAAYVIVCSLRKANNQVRLTVRLIDACTGLHIWARSETYGSSAGFADQDAIIAQIAAAIEPSIYAAEAMRQSRKPFEALDAMSGVTMALAVTRNRARQNYELAERYLARTIELEPDCAKAYSLVAFFLGVQVLWGWKPRERTISLALESARKSILLDNDDSWGHFALGWALTQNRSPEEGAEEYRKAIALNPYFPHAHYGLGSALGYVGRAEEALTAIEAGERLGAPEIFVGHGNSARAAVYFCGEKYDDAIKAAQRSVQQSPGLIVSLRTLFVSSGLEGKAEQARAAFKLLTSQGSSLSLNVIEGALPYIRDGDVNRTLEVFRRMGVK
jgi:DNA-binding winged helix-turn-helix (wHTH) protein